MNEELLKRIDAIAAKFSVTGDHLWKVLVAQSRIEALQDGICALIALAAACGLAKLSHWIYKQEDDSVELFMIALVAAVVAAAIACVYILSIPTELLNPEYFALHRIMESIK